MLKGLRLVRVLRPLDFPYHNLARVSVQEGLTGAGGSGIPGGFMIPPALQKDMTALRDSERFVGDLQSKYATFEFGS